MAMPFSPFRATNHRATAGRGHAAARRRHGTQAGRRRLLVEALEDRRLLSITGPEIELFSTSPALFVENQGQWEDESLRFLHQGDGANVAMTDAGPVFQVFRREEVADTAGTLGEDPWPGLPGDEYLAHDYTTETLQFSASFLGASAVTPVGLEPSETRFNYFVGAQEDWRSGVRSYEVVAYEGLYEGIDLKTWGRRDSLKYEFHVAPGADYTQIRVGYAGVAGLALAEDGSLRVDLGEGWGELVDDAPFVYQTVAGRQVEVPARFVVLDDHSYTFELTGDYDPARELVIDPALNWSTYLGGGSDDDGRAIDVDAAGNVYVAGDTSSPGWARGGFDTSHNGGVDAFVAKLDASGSDMFWTTYLGGDAWDGAWGIDVDAAGNVYVTGDTGSAGWASGGFNTTYSGGGYYVGGDAFVVKLTPDGDHVWSTYLGGTSEDRGYGIQADAAGNIYITGWTQSAGWTSGGFDTTFDGDRDGFLVKLTADGDHAWSTYLGGNDFASFAWDGGTAVAVDGSGNVYVAGAMHSADWINGGFDTTYNGGIVDGFVVKLTHNGEHLWSTYLGGRWSDSAHGVAIDGDGNVYVTGATNSSGWVSGGFDTSFSGYADAFVVKLTATGAHLWSTYLGADDLDVGHGIAVDPSGNAYVTGAFDASGTSSGPFRTTYRSYPTAGNASVVKLTPEGAHAWTVALGGEGSEGAWAIAADGGGGAYVTGYTDSTRWTSGGFDTAYNGGLLDAFVAKIFTEGIGREIQVQAETLARGVAYDDWDTWPADRPIEFDGAVLPYTVDDVFRDDASGFYGLGLLSDDYGPALLLRGGFRNLPDFWADSDPRGVGYNQFEENWQAGENLYGWLAGLGEPADLIGHSLGGALAQWIAAAFTAEGNPIDELITFNSPGISNSQDVYYTANPGDLLTYASDFNPDPALVGAVSHFIVNGDVVSMAGESFLPGDVWMASFSDLNLVNKHRLPLLVPSVGERQRPAALSWEALTAAELSDPLFSYHDPDYELWRTGFQTAILGLAAAKPHLAPVLRPLAGVPAMLEHRGSSEQFRHEIGKALRAAEGAWQWIEEAPGRFVLAFSERVHDLYEATRITVESGFDVTVDDGEPPMLRFDGTLGVDLGDNVQIELPSWLGGTFTADHLVELVDLDTSGVLDRDHLAVEGQLGVLGGFLALEGGAELDWLRGEASLNGSLDIGQGFVTADASIRVGAGLDLVVQGGAAVSVPEGAPWIGGTELAGGQFLLNYVNDLSLSNDFVAAWGSLGPVRLGLRAWFDGRVDLLGGRQIDALGQPAPARLESASASPKDPAAAEADSSESFAVGSDAGWVLFDVQWENDSSTAAITLETPSGQVLDEAGIQADPSMQLVAELSGARRKAVWVDGPEAGTWVVTLSDPGDLGEVQIGAFVSDPVPTVSIVNVTGGQLREPVRIDLEAYDADSDAEISLFYDTDHEGFDGIMLATGIAETDGPVSYTWDTSGVPAGEYYVYARVIDGHNPPVMAYSETPVEITEPGVVMGRHVFYNNSAFDGDAGASAADDSAVAPQPAMGDPGDPTYPGSEPKELGKEALLPGGTATFANYTSYSRGLNGIMVDILGLPGTPTEGDFVFKVGNSPDPSTWADGPAPQEIAVRAGAGTGGSHRVTLIWADDDPYTAQREPGSISKQWLQVTVLATAATGLAEPDIFYFGNAIGECGNSTLETNVDPNDEIGARNHTHSLFNPAPLEDAYDYDRDKKVDTNDEILARNNSSSAFTRLVLFTAPPGLTGDAPLSPAGLPPVAAQPAGGRIDGSTGDGPKAGWLGSLPEAAPVRIDRAARHDAALGELGTEVAEFGASEFDASESEAAESGAAGVADAGSAGERAVDLSWLGEGRWSSGRGRSEVVDPARAAVERLLATL